MNGKIQRLSKNDATEIARVINQAAEMYENVIPEDQYSKPYMPLDELENEMEKMEFYGYFDELLIGVIGLQDLENVTLLRHLYVLPDYHRQGIGTELLDHSLENASANDILVGTWKAAKWAVQFYEKHGFKRVANTQELLQKHWDVPQRQMEESIVLRYRR